MRCAPQGRDRAQEPLAEEDIGGVDVTRLAHNVSAEDAALRAALQAAPWRLQGIPRWEWFQRYRRARALGQPLVVHRAGDCVIRSARDLSEGPAAVVIDPDAEADAERERVWRSLGLRPRKARSGASA
jgi:hypothetical protein